MGPEEAALRATETRGPQAAVLVITFTALAFVAVGFRYATRFFIVKSLGIDDGFIGGAILVSIAMSFCQVEQVRYGSGKHVEVVTPEETVASYRYLFFSMIAYNISLTLTKLAILLLYRRIFLVTRMRIVCYVMMGFVVLYGLQAVIVAIFICNPVQAFWYRSTPGAECLPEFTIFYANAGLNIATDFAIVLLPMPVVGKLQMPKRQKITLMFILAIGGFVCIVSILRLQALVVLDRSSDPTWEQPATAYWSAIELNTGIVCGCLATLKPLINRLAPRVLNSFHSFSRRSEPYENFSGSDHPPMLSLRARCETYGKFPVEPLYGTIDIGTTRSNADSEHSSEEAAGLVVTRYAPSQIQRPQPTMGNRNHAYNL